jgi:hypothetical protein
MATYLITNRMPAEFRPSPDAFAAWTAWFAALGEHLVERGNPAFARAVLGNTGAETVLGGYSLISADSLAAAVDLATSHPLIPLGGGVEIGELTAINAGKELSREYEQTPRV